MLVLYTKLCHIIIVSNHYLFELFMYNICFTNKYHKNTQLRCEKPQNTPLTEIHTAAGTTFHLQAGACYSQRFEVSISNR